MNLNDRIALELGRAHFARILAEEQAERLGAKLAEAESKPKRRRPSKTAPTE